MATWGESGISPCAQGYGHDAMYCTDAMASIGMTDTIEIQLAHALTKPTSEPWE